MTTPGHAPHHVLTWLHDTTLADMPDHVIGFGQRCLLDLIGVAAAGRTTDLSRLIHDHAFDHFGGGRVSVPMLFDGRQVSPAGAALAAGMTIDSIDAHDGNNLTKGHTGCHQLPALFAFVTAEGLTDSQNFLASLIIGYEIATRAGIALHETVPDYHTSGAWGAVGAAALGARLLGLDHAMSFEAMGIGEYHGPRSQMMRCIDHPTMLKDGSGWGAMAGVSAAYLARDGFTGAPAVLLNDPAVDYLWADLGTRWIILEQYFKPLPVCRWAQPAVEAALALRTEHQVDPAQIDRVEVATFHEAARLATAAPATTEQAQYSLPFPVAAALVRGRLGAEEITSDGLNDELIASLASRVVITEDDDHNRAFPSRRFARVSLHLHGGSVLVSDETQPRGDADVPLPGHEIRDKFHSFAAPVVGQERAASIESLVRALTAPGMVAPLLRELSQPPI